MDLDNILDWSNAYADRLGTPLRAQSTQRVLNEKEASALDIDCPKERRSPILLEPSTECISSDGTYAPPSISQDDEHFLNDHSTLTKENENVSTEQANFLRRVEMYKRKRESAIKACRLAVERSAKEARRFRAKPAPKFPVKKKIASQARLATKPQPFQLRTAVRAEQRKEFEQHFREKQQALQRILEEKRRKAEELEAQEIRELRRRTVIRARPISCKLPPRRKTDNTE